MKEPPEHLTDLHGDAASKPAASLADVKIGRKGKRPDSERGPKAGDLTSILQERRQDMQTDDGDDAEIGTSTDADTALVEPEAPAAHEPAPATPGLQTNSAADDTAVTADAEAKMLPVPPHNALPAPAKPEPAEQAASAPADDDPDDENKSDDADKGHLSDPPAVATEPAPSPALENAIKPAPSPAPESPIKEDKKAEAEAESESSPSDGAAKPEDSVSPARAKAKTLRERLMAKRDGAKPAETPAAPAKEERPASETNNGDRDGAGEKAAAPNTEKPAGIPDKEPTDAQRAGETDDGSASQARAAPIRKKNKDKDESAGSANIVTDALLRKRMAAVLQTESKRREEREAKQSEMPKADGAAEEPARAAEHEPTPPAPKWTPPTKPVDIVRYWTLARRGRRLPALSDLDLDEIARNWPDSLLLRYVQDTGLLELERSLARHTAAEAAQSDAASKIDYTPNVIDWVVHQGLVVTKDGNPVRATDEFDVEDGIARYRVVALPLGEDGTEIDHILCHLEPE